jgi:hypothetical protein
MDEIYYVRIKKDYAAAVIEDLQKMEAVELIAPDETEIPDWQKELVNIEKKNIADDPSVLVNWEIARQKYPRR